MDERKDPAIGWYHISYDIVNEGVHFHIQEAVEYPGIRFHWTLDTKTGKRESRFFIRDIQFDSLIDAIDYWNKHLKPPRRRVRL